MIRRFSYDGKPSAVLNKLQLESKAFFEQKVKQNQYTHETVPCIVCQGTSFEPVAQQDRFGLPLSVVVCTDCGLVQTNPRMTQASYNKFYDGEYRKLYLDEAKPDLSYFRRRKLHGEKLHALVSNFVQKPFTNQFVVEIGCGVGGVLQVFKERGNKVFGVDLDSNCVNFGKSQGLNLKVGTYTELAKLQRKPDLVIYYHVVEHLLNPIEELKQLRKYLTENSLVLIVVPGIKNLYTTYAQDFLRYLQNAHTYHFSLTTLTNVIQKAGFEAQYADEKVCVILKKSQKPIQSTYVNDYPDVIAYLERLEHTRKNLFNAVTFKHKGRVIASKLLNVTGTKKIVRKLNSKLRENHLR